MKSNKSDTILWTQKDACLKKNQIASIYENNEYSLGKEVVHFFA